MYSEEIIASATNLGENVSPVALYDQKEPAVTTVDTTEDVTEIYTH